MARSYMHDITPPEEGDMSPEEPRIPPERSIRNIEPSATRVRMTRAAPARPPVETREQYPVRTPRRSWGVWIVAVISIIILGGAGAFVFFPATTVTIIPRVQNVPFDPAIPFTAYPESTAAPGSISYATLSQVFEDSAVVAANGLENVEEKATGVITVYNAYSDTPARLIKNTRFQTANGLIFRIPASVDVPGKKGSTPGSIEVTVFADQPGDTYNIPPQDKLTLPGLKSTPDMFTGVYAKSSAPFTGGFSGERPAVAQGTLDAARSEIRSRLTEKVQNLAATAPEDSFAFPGLSNISFETLPPTTEAGGSVRIHERATVVIPVFNRNTFGTSIAQAVTASAEGQSISIRFAPSVTASASSTLAQGEVGQKPLVFSLSGTGQLVWNPDASAVTQALAGKEKAAFETIIGGFPAIEEARARITPLWQKYFPKDPSKITVVVEPPAEPF